MLIDSEKNNPNNLPSSTYYHQLNNTSSSSLQSSTFISSTAPLSISNSTNTPRTVQLITFFIQSNRPITSYITIPKSHITKKIFHYLRNQQGI